MTESGFRSLIVWQKAQNFAVAVMALAAGLPHRQPAEPIGNQLVRAAGSISANIAEGYGRFSSGAYRNHLSIARGSAFEAESWIDLLVRAGDISSEANASLLGQLYEVDRLLTARMKSLDEKSGRFIHEEAEPYFSEGEDQL
jgi:four helix bundle protein